MNTIQYLICLPIIINSLKITFNPIEYENKEYWSLTFKTKMQINTVLRYYFMLSKVEIVKKHLRNITVKSVYLSLTRIYKLYIF